MFVVIMEVTDKARAAPYMDGHNAWIRSGFDEGVFVLIGSLQPGPGGVILVDDVSREAIDARVAEDPFVAQGIVDVRILDVSAWRTDARLDFLKAAA